MFEDMHVIKTFTRIIASKVNNLDFTDSNSSMLVHTTKKTVCLITSCRKGCPARLPSTNCARHQKEAVSSLKAGKQIHAMCGRSFYNLVELSSDA
ncbi:hypothetical protein PsorP6_000756 [Peronosclerospora sorghi]|uniref:Uncharacterized protein n=1 Tax=Peronosclerospora sorghi TaxID=230839 RepID=A0ACC0WTY7_9STRA|nr:hypothetical protein PsorP6_000756 [Peronosclerospora sorghi]